MYCATHANEKGTHSSIRCGGSLAACAALHRLTEEQGWLIEPNTHVHFEKGQLPMGKEYPINLDRRRRTMDGWIRVHAGGPLMAFQVCFIL